MRYWHCFVFWVLCLSGLWISEIRAEDVSLQFPNSPVDSVLGQYEALTGKRIIRAPNLAGPNIRLVINGTVDKEEAIRLIEAALLINGYSLVPGGDNTVKVLNVANKKPQTEGVPIYTRLEDLPKADQVAAFYMPLSYIDPSQAAEMFQQQGGQNPYSAIVQMKDARAILITDNTSVIRKMAQLKQLADVPPSRLTREFVQLRRADAERVAETLQKLIQERRQQQQQSGGAPASPTERPVANGQPADVGSLLTGDIQLMPDARTNRILVICSPVNFTYVKELIEQFDIAVEFDKPFVRSLNYVAANDVLPVLANTLAEGGEEVKEGASAGSSGSSSARSGAASGSSSFGGGSSGGSSIADKPDKLGSPDAEQAPQSVTVGKTRLIADNRSNAIMVIGSPESIAKVSDLLDNLDVRPRQVFLSTVIGQLTLTKDTEFGVDILQKFKNATGDSGAATSSITQPSSSSFLDPRSLTSAGIFPAVGGLTVYGAFGDVIDVYVTALETTNNFRVLSRPSVFTANNKKATIVSGRKEPVPTQTITDVSTGNTNSSVSYEDVVLKLEVIPLINAQNEVTLQVSQQNNNIVDNRVISGNSIPVISTQEVTTEVKVANNNTVILGGLIEDTAQQQQTGIPILMDIPVLGYLFKDTKTSRPRRELIVMIQPQVIAEYEGEQQKSDEELRRYKFGPDTKDGLDSATPYRTPLSDSERKKNKNIRQQAFVPKQETPEPAPVPTLPKQEESSGQGDDEKSEAPTVSVPAEPQA